MVSVPAACTVVAAKHLKRDMGPHGGCTALCLARSGKPVLSVLAELVLIVRHQQPQH